jgi:hypothetical protein
MYTIIGGDGKEYGPVTAEQVQVWIAAGRANLQTRAKALGTDDWKSLGDFPDFSGAGQAEPQVVGSAPMAGTEGIAANLKARAGELDIASCYERSWELLKSNFWSLVGVTALVVILEKGIVLWTYFSLGQVAEYVVAGLIGPVFLGGLQYYYLKKIRGHAATSADAFAGFTTALLPLILGGLVGGVLVACGIILLILPGIYLAVAYTFAWLLIVDRKLDFWTALEVSRRVITAQWWRVLGLVLLGVVFALLGVIALIIGIFVALPLFYGALVYAYEV